MPNTELVVPGIDAVTAAAANLGIVATEVVLAAQGFSALVATPA